MEKVSCILIFTVYDSVCFNIIIHPFSFSSNVWKTPELQHRRRDKPWRLLLLHTPVYLSLYFVDETWAMVTAPPTSRRWRRSRWIISPIERRRKICGVPSRNLARLETCTSRETSFLVKAEALPLLGKRFSGMFQWAVSILRLMLPRAMHRDRMKWILPFSKR